MVAVEERGRRLHEGVQAGTELTMGHLPAELSPPPRKRGEPRAGGRPVPPDHPPGRGADHRLDVIIGRGIRVIPRHREGARGMRVNQRLPPFGALLAPLAAAAYHHGVARRRGDRAQPIPRVRRPRGGS